MNFKGNLLIIICLLCSVAGLVLIYFAAINIQPMQLQLSEINFELVGRTVRTTGYISYKNSHPNGHLFLTITDGKAKLQVPLFAGFVTALEGNGLTKDDFRKGRRIVVEGLISEYRGQLQIIPRKPEDIKIFSD